MERAMSDVATGEQSESYNEPVVTIHGDRVALGPLRRDPIPLYARWFNDLETLRTLAVPPLPMTLERETAWFEAATLSTSDTLFTSYERSSWRPIGTAALHAIDHRHRTAELGIVIGEADCRNKAFGTEIVRLLLDYAFNALQLHNVLLRVYAYNPAAHRAYAKAGFREIGRRRSSVRFAGRAWDEILMDCVADEFESPRIQAIFSPTPPR
jgi:RimJ/RimL family protein N-acetyltransferase